MKALLMMWIMIFILCIINVRGRLCPGIPKATCTIWCSAVIPVVTVAVAVAATVKDVAFVFVVLVKIMLRGVP